MWIDNDTPGCLYDTIDCTGWCCERGRKMYDSYLEEKKDLKIEKEKQIKKQRLLKNNKGGYYEVDQKSLTVIVKQ